MALIEVEGPQVEPLELEFVKSDHLRVVGDDDNLYISNLIRTVRRSVEIETQRAFITRKYKAVIDHFPGCSEIRLEKPPLQSVESVKYYDQAGVLTVLSASDYLVDVASEPGRLILKYGLHWPYTWFNPNAVEIEYTAGYGDLPEDVPEDLQQAMLLMIGHYFSVREPVVVGQTVFAVPRSAEFLAAPHRVWS